MPLSSLLKRKRASETEINLQIIRNLVPEAADVFLLIDFLAHFVPGLPRTAELGQILEKQPLVVAIHRDDAFPKLDIVTSKCSESHASLIDGVVCTLLAQQDRPTRTSSPRNILTHGYTIGRESSHTWGKVPGVHVMHANSNVDYLKTLLVDLHRQIGDDVLRAIILRTALFLPLEDDNFWQLCGPPLTGRVIRAHTRQPRRKRRRARKPLDLSLRLHGTLSRRSLFYSNAYIPRAGLPSSHLLHSATDGRHVMLRILKAPGVAALSELQREILADACADMLKLYKRFDVARALECYCPLPAFCRTSNGIRRGVALPEVSASFTPSDRVISFLKSLVVNVFPLGLFGSSQNRDQVLQSVEAFVMLRRRESMANKLLMKGIHVTKVPWLYPRNDRKVSRNQSLRRETLMLRFIRWIFNCFVVPLLRSVFHVTETEFGGLLVMFYRKPVWAIFRHLSTNQLLEHQFAELSPEQALGRQKRQQLGFSRLRLLPKETGVRPIAVLSKREKIMVVETQEEFPTRDEIFVPAAQAPKLTIRTTRYGSTNQRLSETLSALRHEYDHDDSAFGSGLLGLSYFYARYRSFVDEAQPARQKNMLCFGSVDIKHCYDNINQQHLLEVVDRVLCKNEYILQPYRAVHLDASLSQVQRRRHKHVVSPASFAPLHRVLDKLGRHHSSVIINEGHDGLVDKHQAMKTLHEHLTGHLVVTRGRYKDRYFVQKKGIPQGSVLSSYLCNFYYGDVEKKLLGDSKPAVQPNASLLGRMIDDFLIISTRCECVKHFLKTMSKGNADLGVSVNPEKTLSTVVVEGVTRNEHMCSSRFFPWCGMLFDRSNGEVRVDYSRYERGMSGDRLTVSKTANEGIELLFQMKIFVRPRCRPIFFDSVINSRPTQGLNMYQAFAFAAVKYIYYVDGYSRTFTPALLCQGVEESAHFAYVVVRRHLQTFGFGQTSLSEDCSAWLARRAYIDVLRHTNRFPEHVKALKSRQNSISASSLSGMNLEQVARHAIANFHVERHL